MRPMRTVAVGAMAGVIARAVVGQVSRLPRKSRERGDVLIVNHYANPPDLAGGTRHHELASLLADDGWKPVVVATGFNHRSGDFHRGISWKRPVVRRDESGVPFVWLYSLPYSDNGLRRYLNMATFAALVSMVGATGRRPSIVVGSSPHLLAALGAWAVAKRHRVPFVLEIRDLWPDSLIQLGLSNRRIIGVLSAIERFLYGHADAIVALTEGIRDGIIAKGIPQEKLAMIPNASRRPVPGDPAERDRERQRRGWIDKTVAIWIGAHGPANALESVVEAARLLADREDIRFVFIGDGPDKADLQRRASGLTTVEFHDPVSKQEVLPILRAADIGILHSRAFDAFTGARPNKLFDYMAAALPIVCAIPGEALRLVEEAGAGIAAEWENPQSIAERIRHLADAPALRESMGPNGFAFVSRAHSRENTASHLSDLLLHVIRLHTDKQATQETSFPSLQEQQA